LFREGDIVAESSYADRAEFLHTHGVEEIFDEVARRGELELAALRRSRGVETCALVLRARALTSKRPSRNIPGNEDTAVPLARDGLLDRLRDLELEAVALGSVAAFLVVGRDQNHARERILLELALGQRKSRALPLYRL
jgi:hypothetical protein